MQGCIRAGQSWRLSSPKHMATRRREPLYLIQSSPAISPDCPASTSAWHLVLDLSATESGPCARNTRAFVVHALHPRRTCDNISSQVKDVEGVISSPMMAGGSLVLRMYSVSSSSRGETRGGLLLGCCRHQLFQHHLHYHGRVNLTPTPMTPYYPQALLSSTSAGGLSGRECTESVSTLKSLQQPEALVASGCKSLHKVAIAY